MPVYGIYPLMRPMLSEKVERAARIQRSSARCADNGHATSALAICSGCIVWVPPCLQVGFASLSHRTKPSALKRRIGGVGQSKCDRGADRIALTGDAADAPFGTTRRSTGMHKR